jgi:hypothetical protein
VTVDLTGADDITEEVERFHAYIDESYITLAGDNERLSGQSNNPTEIPRGAIFRWFPDPQSWDPTSIGAPEGYTVQFLFDGGTFRIDQGGPVNSGGNPDSVCEVLTNGNKAYEKSYFPLPSDFDCNPTLCAEELGIDPSLVVCRLHVQIYTADVFGNTSAWTAGMDAFWRFEE